MCDSKNHHAEINTDDIGDFFSSSSGTSPEEAVDKIKVMRQQEESMLCTDYLSHNFASDNNLKRAIDVDCRTKMCEWCYQVADFCKYQRECVGIGMYYLDRFLCSGSTGARAALTDRKLYQLAAMTSFFIAIKLFESSNSQIEVKTLSQLSRGCYSEEEIVDMETHILTSLSWRMHQPTSVAFVHHFLALLPTHRRHDKFALQVLLDVSLYQTELAVGEYELAFRHPSSIALAAIINAMNILGKQHFTEIEKIHFLEILSSAADINPSSFEMQSIQKFLGFCLSKNASEEMTYALRQINVRKQDSDSTSQCVSPTCVTDSYFYTAQQ